jgi:hypothetical protein
MFTYCKRTTIESNAPFNYLKIQDSKPKKITARYCNNLNLPYVQFRGIPTELVDISTQLKGQDSSMQTLCSNEEAGLDEVDLSSYRRMPFIHKPCMGPSPRVEMTPLNNCCNCDKYLGVNPVKPMAGSLGVMNNSDFKIRK